MKGLLFSIYGSLICACSLVMLVYVLPDIKQGAVWNKAFVFCMFFATVHAGLQIAYEGIKIAETE